ncbi:MAG: hypothetical protein C4519_24385 [Desulfobacteraceae bacterium]|nr:MAG: hypothetical protein C4519_24385 [Desulfobacteraceae bacterium]
MYSSIKTGIKTHLEAIDGIKKVYGYEKGELDGYPSAVVILDAIETELETTAEDTRKYSFKIKIYQELDKDGIGAEEAESRVEALLDTILGKFEDDYTLGGLCYNSNIKGIAGWADRGNKERVLEFTLECFAIYSLT